MSCGPRRECERCDRKGGLGLSEKGGEIREKEKRNYTCRHFCHFTGAKAKFLKEVKNGAYFFNYATHEE